MKQASVHYEPGPDAIAATQLTAFLRFCERETGSRVGDQAELHRLWVRDHRRYWSLFLRWSGLRYQGEPEPVCVGDGVEHAAFFPALRLSYAGNLLWQLDDEDDERPALTAISETGHIVWLTRGELREDVARLAGGLRALGLAPGEAVAAVARNSAEAVEACLAAASLGAVWSAAGPELATDEILRRFRPLEPVVLFAHSEWSYDGVRRSLGERLRAIVDALPSLRAVVTLDVPRASLELGRPVHGLGPLLEQAPEADPWPSFPFAHPLFVLFTSGDAGAPEGVVHGAGGTLLELLKQHRLHGDLGPGDRLLFLTSTGSATWTWQLSALASGAEIVLYDGSPGYPRENALWRLVSQEKVTVFGTSSSYLQSCRDASIAPAGSFELGALRAVLASGPGPDALYEWVAENVGPVPLQEMHAGDGMVGSFALGSPNLPVYRGESQCLSLGLDLRVRPSQDAPAWDEGALVCGRPFPSRPLGFVNDPDGRRFHRAYFAPHEGLWTQGDTVRLSERGTVRVLGRSDDEDA